MIHSRQLDDKSFLTLIAEVEAIINLGRQSINSLGDDYSDPPYFDNEVKCCVSTTTVFSKARFYCRRCGDEPVLSRSILV